LVVKILKPPEGPKGRKDKSRNNVKILKPPERPKYVMEIPKSVVYHSELHTKVVRFDFVKLTAKNKKQEQELQRLMNRHLWALNYILRYLRLKGNLKEIAEKGIPENLYRELFSILTSQYHLPSWLVRGCLAEAYDMIKETVNASNKVGSIEAKRPRLYLDTTECLNLKKGYCLIKGAGIRLRVEGYNWKYKDCRYRKWARLLYDPKHKAFYLQLTMFVEPLCVYPDYKDRKRKEYRGAYAVDFNKNRIFAGTGDPLLDLEFRPPTERIQPIEIELERLRRKYPKQGSYDPLERRKGLKHRVEALRKKILDIVRYTPKRKLLKWGLLLKLGRVTTPDRKEKLVEWFRERELRKKQGYSIILIAKEIVARAYNHGYDHDQGYYYGYPLVLENLRNMAERLRKNKIYDLYYYIFDRAIISEAKLRGVPVFFVDPAYTSTTCPRCGGRMVQINDPTTWGERTMVCTQCGLKEDRERVAIINLIKKFISEHPEYR
jgi:putative transposase